MSRSRARRCRSSVIVTGAEVTDPGDAPPRRGTAGRRPVRVCGVSVLAVPYHLDEFLPALDLPLQPDEVITADLPAGGPWDRLAVLYGAVARAVAASSARGECPVVVSGDCTTALGTVAGLQAGGATVGIVWFDAHGDVQTPETTASGYLGGMPLRLLAGYAPALIASRLGLRPVPEDTIVLAGVRDVDPPEVLYLAQSGIRRRELAGLDLAAVPQAPLYVHVDLDVLDPAEVPGLRYPAPGGPPPAQLSAALRMLVASGRVAGIGVACTWHPGHAAAAHIGDLLATALTPASQ
jgi:arginase